MYFLFMNSQSSSSSERIFNFTSFPTEKRLSGSSVSRLRTVERKRDRSSSGNRERAARPTPISQTAAAGSNLVSCLNLCYYMNTSKYLFICLIYIDRSNVVM